MQFAIGLLLGAGGACLGFAFAVNIALLEGILCP